MLTVRRATLTICKRQKGLWNPYSKMVELEMSLLLASERMCSVKRHPDDVFNSWWDIVWNTYSLQCLSIKKVIFPILGLTVPLMVSGTLSRFRNGESTVMQKFWTISWLVFGSLVPFRWKIHQVPNSFMDILGCASMLVAIAPIAVAVLAIGGFSVSAQMFNEHGVCVGFPTRAKDCNIGPSGQRGWEDCWSALVQSLTFDGSLYLRLCIMSLPPPILRETRYSRESFRHIATPFSETEKWCSWKHNTQQNRETRTDPGKIHTIQRTPLPFHTYFQCCMHAAPSRRSTPHSAHHAPSLAS
jgi:hypothetical protein